MADNLPSGVTDATVDAAWGECFEGCESWSGGDCCCDEIEEEFRGERLVEQYLSSRDYD